MANCTYLRWSDLNSFCHWPKSVSNFLINVLCIVYIILLHKWMGYRKMKRNWVYEWDKRAQDS